LLFQVVPKHFISSSYVFSHDVNSRSFRYPKIDVYVGTPKTQILAPAMLLNIVHIVYIV